MPLPLDKSSFLEKYGLTEIYESLSDEYSISWDDLNVIYDDYDAIYKSKEIHEIADSLVAQLREHENIHYVSCRVKSPEHLIAKIIRNKKSNSSKYKCLDINNYRILITDIIGIRILTKYKEEWEAVHDILCDLFENDESKYIKFASSTYNYIDNIDLLCMLEPPVAYSKYGDKDIYKKKINCKYSNKGYRSIHYIVKYKNIHCEIQLRTLAEEIYGEFDHDVRYPFKIKDTFLTSYTDNIAKATSVIDELMTILNCMPDDVRDQCSEHYNIDIQDHRFEIVSEEQKDEIAIKYPNIATEPISLKDVGNTVINRQ